MNSLNDLRRAFYGATTTQSLADAEYEALLGMIEDGISFPNAYKANVYIPPGWGKRWRAARTQSEDRLVRVGMFGDSLPVGPYTDNFDLSFTAIIRNALQGAYGNGGTGWLDWGNSGVGGFGGPGGPNGQDSTETGAWTNIASGVNGFTRRPTVDGNGATMTFHPIGTTVDIVSRTDPTFGRYDRQINGGSVIQVPQNSGPAVSTVSVGSLPTTQHSVVLTAAAGQCRINGVRGRNDQGVLVDNFSSGGRSIASSAGLQVAAEGLAGQTTRTTTFQVMQLLDMFIFCLGVNEAPAASTATQDQIWEQLGLLQRSLRNAGVNSITPPEVIVIIPHIAGFVDGEPGFKYPRISSTLREYAISLNGAVVDMWAAGWHSTEKYNDLGWWGIVPGDVHPSVIGHQAYAEPLNDLLLN